MQEHRSAGTKAYSPIPIKSIPYSIWILIDKVLHFIREHLCSFALTLCQSSIG